MSRPAGELTILPDLPGAGEADGGVAAAVIRGVTDLAPDGGVSVGGFATIGAFSPDDEGGAAHATIWTCAYAH